jgi:hypothetical protein
MRQQLGKLPLALRVLVLVIALGASILLLLTMIGLVTDTFGRISKFMSATEQQQASSSQSDGDSSPPEEASQPAPGYSLFKHDSGALSVEVPTEWDERLVVDSEGEKGRPSWSSFLKEGESIGPSLTAVNDLSSWRNGTKGHQGVYMVASKSLAQKYTDDDLVDSGPNDYSSSCERGTLQDFDRFPYTGKILEWKNCGGDSDHTATTLAASPKDRDCVVVAQVGGYIKTQTDKDNVQHVLDTIKTDCSKIG